MLLVGDAQLTAITGASERALSRLDELLPQLQDVMMLEEKGSPALAQLGPDQSSTAARQAVHKHKVCSRSVTAAGLVQSACLSMPTMSMFHHTISEWVLDVS